MRQIAASTLSNQNIAAALNIYTYTADADREIYFRVFADQIAGNGDYVAYATIQRLGAGAAYRVVPITTAAVASGVTSAALVTTAIPVKNTDVVKLYLIGLAGDTTTPDITSEVWEADYLRPNTAGQHNVEVNFTGKLDISAINGDSAASANLAVAYGSAISGQCNGAGTASDFPSNVTGYGNDSLNNRLLIFHTGAVNNRHVRRIIDYVSATGRIYLDAPLPTPVFNGDNFLILPDYGAVDVDAINSDQPAADNLAANIGNLDATISGRASAADLAIVAGYIDTEVAAIKSDTAAILDDTGTSGVVVAAGSKTGYALSAAGVQAIWEYVTRTLTSGGGGATAAEVWDYLTSSITTAGSIGKLIKDKLGLITTATEITVDSPVNGGLLTITKAVTLESGLLDVAVPAGWTKCYVTGKKSKHNADPDALFQIVLSNPADGDDGLLYLNGAAGTASEGSVTVDEGNNQVSFTLTDNVTAQLAKQNGYWDIKFLVDGGSSIRPVAGLLEIVLPVTLTI